MTPPRRGVLLLDVDGVLNPDVTRNQVEKRTHTLAHRYRLYRFLGFRVFLSVEHGPMLRAFADRFALDLAWATSWEQHANELIGPVVGLPPLPVVEFGPAPIMPRPAWKFPQVADYVGDRDVVWFDDDLAWRPAAAAEFTRNRPAAATVLRVVDPSRGLTMADLDAAADELTAARTLRLDPQPGGNDTSRGE